MKTNGFREIDFSKTECKNCGYNQFNTGCYIGYIEKGKVVKFGYSNKSPFYTVEFEDCYLCKGTGFINESVTTELELE